MESLKILHLDDNFLELRKVRGVLHHPKYQLESVQTVEDFRGRLRDFRPDVVLLDVNLPEPGPSGIELLPEVKSSLPEAAVFMRSALEDAPIVTEALKVGAHDFFLKDDDQALIAALTEAFRLTQVRRGVHESAESPVLGEALALVAGLTLRKLVQRLPQILASAVQTIHIFGESGTGKEVVADLFAVMLKSTPFVRINCGAISPTLMESELFGHSKGAFTGASSDKIGLVESASGGWLFLDEVSTLSPAAQIALLRVIENQQVTRVGESRARPVQVRILSACNEDLEALVAQGRFRRDLWQRLRETEIRLPPLSERKEEIPELVEHFCRMMPNGPWKISRAALNILQAYDWRGGNVRELRNCLRAMTEFPVGGMLTPLSIPEHVLQAGRVMNAVPEPPPASTPAPVPAEGTFSSPAPHLTLAEGVVQQGDVNGIFLAIPTLRPQGCEYPYEQLCTRLFEILLGVAETRLPSLSVRKLGTFLDLPKTTVARRLQEMRGWKEGEGDPMA